MTSVLHDGPRLAFPQSLTPPDLLRTWVQQVVQQMIEAEFQQLVGAGRYERTPDRRDVRNGTRPRRFTTRVGTLDLRIPRDRSGQFQPALFARYQRSEQAFVAALAEMYVQGVSTRKVSAVVETLCGETVSASQVSAMTATLDASLATWRARALTGSYRYLLFDAHVERVRREGEVRATAVLWVIGVNAEGHREHLGVWLGASESAASWRAVCEDLIQRGLRGVQYVVADDHAGLQQELRRFFPDAVLQRCQVHFLRNALDKVSSDERRTQVKDGLRTVWGAGTRRDAEAHLARLVTELRPTVPRLADWLETDAPATLGVFALADREARKKLATTNGIEHDHMAVRRRTRVIRVFPNEASLLRLTTALAQERSDTWLARRYLAPLTAHAEVLTRAA